MRFGKMPEPMHEPLGGEIRRSTNGEDAGVLTLQKPLGANGDTVQRIAHDVEVVLARFCDDESLAFAIEELDGELGLERFDLMAHRALVTHSSSAALVKLSCRAAASKAFRAFNGGRRGRIVPLHEKN